MKRTIIAFAVICLGIFTSAAIAGETTYDFKLGTGYATDPEKFGFQLNAGYYNEFDPFFVIGVEPGIYWINWEEKVGEETAGNITADVKKDSNAYMIPIMANGQIRLPNLRKSLYLLPHITIGIGYSMMIYDYNQPAYTDAADVEHEGQSDTDFYSGLTWQILVGGTFKPGRESNIGFLFEGGYRGVKLKRKDLEVDMSGFIINLGVRYPFGNPRPDNPYTRISI